MHRKKDLIKDDTTHVHSDHAEETLLKPKELLGYVLSVISVIISVDQFNEDQINLFEMKLAQYLKGKDILQLLIDAGGVEKIAIVEFFTCNDLWFLLPEFLIPEEPIVAKQDNFEIKKMRKNTVFLRIIIIWSRTPKKLKIKIRN